MSERMTRISSRGNSAVKEFVKLRGNPTAHHPYFVVDGEKLVAEVVKSKHQIVRLFVRVGSEEAAIDIPASERVVVTPEVMQKLSAHAQPARMVAVCERTSDFHSGSIVGRWPWLVLDGVQDPGNVGAIFRSAEAFGGLPMIMLPPSTTPFSVKVIRASAGSSLRGLYWRVSTHEEFMQVVREQQVQLWSLDPEGGTVLDMIDPGKRAAFILGNEGHGISPFFQSVKTKTVRIPMSRDVNSLNVATSAALLAYHLFGETGRPSP